MYFSFIIGAFLVPYLSMLFLCGIPLFFMETCLGQFSNIGCLTIFRIAPLFKGNTESINWKQQKRKSVFLQQTLGAGYAIIIVNLICTTYYNVIIAYPIVFIFKSFAKTLPWVNCNNAWNTPYCLEVGSFLNLGIYSSLQKLRKFLILSGHTCKRRWQNSRF